MNLSLRLGVNPHSLLACEVAHHVQVMGGQVNDYTHVPDASGKRPQPPAAHLEDTAQLARLQPLLQRSHGRVEAHDVTHHQFAPQYIGSLNQFLRLILGRRDGLLDQHVAASLQRVQRHLVMELSRQRDRDDLRAGLAQQSAVVGVGHRVTQLRDPLTSLGARVGHPHQLRGGHLVVDTRVVLSHRAYADHCCFDHLPPMPVPGSDAAHPTLLHVQHCTLSLPLSPIIAARTAPPWELWIWDWMKSLSPASW